MASPVGVGREDAHAREMVEISEGPIVQPPHIKPPLALAESLEPVEISDTEDTEDTEKEADLIYQCTTTIIDLTCANIELMRERLDRHQLLVAGERISYHECTRYMDVLVEFLEWQRGRKFKYGMEPAVSRMVNDALAVAAKSPTRARERSRSPPIGGGLLFFENASSASSSNLGN